MSTRTKHVLLVAVVALVALGAVAGVAAADGDLSIGIDDADDDPVVTVTDGNETVENASVTVETVEENATYAGTGNYTTDANGTVDLPVPETDVTVEVTAEHEGETASTTVDLVAEADDASSFGDLVRSFIASIDDRAGGIGSAVSDYVTENNPGNAPDHAGNGTDAGHGPPDHVGNESDTEQGPPDHAGNGNGDGANGASDGSDEVDGSGDAGNGTGQNAGNPPGNGNAPGNGNGPPGN